jgi:hypothetical protein
VKVEYKSHIECGNTKFSFISIEFNSHIHQVVVDSSHTQSTVKIADFSYGELKKAPEA